MDKKLNQEVRKAWEAEGVKPVTCICGGVWPPAAKFCGYCGTKLEKNNQSLKEDSGAAS